MKSQNPTLLFLSETLVAGTVITDISRKLGFPESFVVEKFGRSGGLAVLWKNVLKCKMTSSSLNHINMHIMDNNVPVWRFTCYYGFPRRERRQEAWDFLRHLAQNNSLPWCIFGDFNDLLYTSDKMGKNPHP